MERFQSAKTKLSKSANRNHKMQILRKQQLNE